MLGLAAALMPLAAWSRRGEDAPRAERVRDRTDSGRSGSRDNDARVRDTGSTNDSRSGSSGSDATRDAARAAEDAEKRAADVAEQQVKEAEDAAKAAQDAEEDAAKAAEDVAEDAAKDAEDALEEAAEAESRKTLGAQENPQYDPNGHPARRGEVVSLDLSDSAVARATRLGFTVVADVRLAALEMRLIRLRVPDGMTTAQALAMLRAEGDNRGVDYDHFYGVQGAAITTARAATVLPPPLSQGRKPLSVGMIDTAVAPHPVMKQVKLEVRDFSGAKGVMPVRHGTAVASVLARAGANQLISANVFSSEKQPYAPAEAIVRAIDWLVGRRVPIINVSIAGPHNLVIDRVVAAASAKGHMIVAAAGNDGPTAPAAFPAASPGAVAVTAVDGAGRVYLHASRGQHIAIAARGVAVMAAVAGGGLRSHSGTSFAAPFVTAYLARCVGDAGPSRTSACVRKMLSTAIDLGAPGRDPVYGAGLLTP